MHHAVGVGSHRVASARGVWSRAGAQGSVHRPAPQSPPPLVLAAPFFFFLAALCLSLACVGAVSPLCQAEHATPVGVGACELSLGRCLRPAAWPSPPSHLMSSCLSCRSPTSAPSARRSAKAYTRLRRYSAAPNTMLVTEEGGGGGGQAAQPLSLPLPRCLRLKRPRRCGAALAQQRYETQRSSAAQRGAPTSAPTSSLAPAAGALRGKWHRKPHNALSRKGSRLS